MQGAFNQYTSFLEHKILCVIATRNDLMNCVFTFAYSFILTLHLQNGKYTISKVSTVSCHFPNSGLRMPSTFSCSFPWRNYSLNWQHFCTYSLWRGLHENTLLMLWVLERKRKINQKRCLLSSEFLTWKNPNRLSA